MAQHNEHLSPLLLSTRSAAVFFLKQLERRRGLAFVRSLLQRAPFADCDWMRAWKASGEVALLRFLGTSKLPRLNPFASLQLWPVVHPAMAAALAPAGDLLQLESCVQEYAQVDASGLKAALLGALFHESTFVHLSENQFY